MIHPLPTLQELSKRSPLIRRAEAIEAGVSSSTLTELTRAGILIRAGRGLYQLAEEAAEVPNFELAEVALKHSKGVIVLLSALSFHGIGTHPAREVWLQLPINAPTPASKWPPLRVIRSRLEAAFSEGVEVHQIAGRSVRITSIDRTIVDCFKHRQLVGLEVCLEALRERLRDRRDNLQNLNRYARLMRGSRVMQPYLEALA